MLARTFSQTLKPHKGRLVCGKWKIYVTERKKYTKLWEGCIYPLLKVI